MTPTLLRQGAALVRALVEGDETARLPLADHCEEWGLPGCSPAQIERICEWLRYHKHCLVYGTLPSPWVGSTHPMFFGGPIQLGTWPSWAWGEGETVPR